MMMFLLLSYHRHLGFLNVPDLKVYSGGMIRWQKTIKGGVEISGSEINQEVDVLKLNRVSL